MDGICGSQAAQGEMTSDSEQAAALQTWGLGNFSELLGNSLGNNRQFRLSDFFTTLLIARELAVIDDD